MKFVSTRGKSAAVSFGQALAQGLAPDGGLYMPESWPTLKISDFDGASSLPEVAEIFLQPFVAGDPIAAQIGDIVRDAFDFPAPLRPVNEDGSLSVLLNLGNGTFASRAPRMSSVTHSNIGFCNRPGSIVTTRIP